MGKTSLITELQRKTEKLIGNDVSFFLCRERKILSIQKVQIFIGKEPSSDEKQLIPINGKVIIRFDNGNGDYLEENHSFLGQIEVENYSTLIGVKDAPFVIHTNVF